MTRRWSPADHRNTDSIAEPALLTAKMSYARLRVVEVPTPAAPLPPPLAESE